MYEANFKGHQFRFLTIAKHPGMVFVPQKDVLAAFYASMPKMPKEFNEHALALGIQESIEAGERQRAIVGGVIEPVVSTDAIMTMAQGMPFGEKYTLPSWARAAGTWGVICVVSF